MSHYTLGYLLLLLAVTTLLFLTVAYFRRVYSWPSRLRSRLVGLSLAFFVAVYALMALELVVKRAFVETDAAYSTLASREWLHRYWKPINRYGFRDPDYDLGALGGKNRLFVLGDSYVMGYGIRNPEDRMGNVLGRTLGPGWAVVNMAKLGWDTGAEAEALRASPVAPDVILLVYVYDDIEGAAHHFGLMTQGDLYRPSPITRAIISRSYLLDFVYYRFYWPYALRPRLLRAYERFTEQSFSEPVILGAHLKELDDLAAYARRSGARLLAIVFPAFDDLEGTRDLLAPVFERLESRDVPVIDLAPVFAGRPMEALAVNSVDHHPNEAVHREVAALAYERMRKEGMLKGGS